jgi:hypothetical protein
MHGIRVFQTPLSLYNSMCPWAMHAGQIVCILNRQESIFGLSCPMYLFGFANSYYNDELSISMFCR